MICESGSLLKMDGESLPMKATSYNMRADTGVHVRK